MTMTIRDQINELQSNFCPYGWLDLQFCVNVANSIGETTDWIFEQIEEFKNSLDLDYKDIDPCYVVYERILENFRNEISNLTSVDISNDFKNPIDDVHGNFYCTCYDINEKAKEELRKLLKKHKIKRQDLSLSSQFFLENI